MDENEYDSKSLEILMIDLAKNKENYKLAVEVILSFGIYAIEDRNFVTLKRILDITNQWIGEFIDYPQIENCYVFMNRLIFAEQTASLHLVNSSFEENNHEGNQSFKTLWEMIKQGSFDNIEDQLEYIEGKTATIPVYSNMDIISDDIGDSPVYWVFSTFPPKDAYMGLIISDDSMLSIIHKGDLVWIQKKKPKSGDIKICRIENEKRWVIEKFEKIDGKDMLIPDNKEYKSFLLGKVEKEEIKGIMVDFENG